MRFRAMTPGCGIYLALMAVPETWEVIVIHCLYDLDPQVVLTQGPNLRMWVAFVDFPLPFWRLPGKRSCKARLDRAAKSETQSL